MSYFFFVPLSLVPASQKLSLIKKNELGSNPPVSYIHSPQSPQSPEKTHSFSDRVNSFEEQFLMNMLDLKIKQKAQDHYCPWSSISTQFFVFVFVSASHCRMCSTHHRACVFEWCFISFREPAPPLLISPCQKCLYLITLSVSEPGHGVGANRAAFLFSKKINKHTKKNKKTRNFLGYWSNFVFFSSPSFSPWMENNQKSFWWLLMTYKPIWI